MWDTRRQIRYMEVLSTDFPSAPPRAPWTHLIGVGSAFFATLTLGFTEACLKLEQRPIPLRFALRFAFANVLPSVVWNSVPVHHIAAASGLPFSALVHETALVSSHSVAIGKRLVLVKSVQALRLAAGSYGLAWGLWHWYDAMKRDDALKADVKYRESVVRLAPTTSSLSITSKRKHGDHLLTLLTDTLTKPGEVSIDIDWENVGIHVMERRMRMKVIEVELNEETAAYAAELKTEAMKEKAAVCSVAVLPLCEPPLPLSIIDAFDVCFNPLSAVLTFIASVCHERGVAHMRIVSSPSDQGETSIAAASNEKSLREHDLTPQLARGLLYRHGISSTLWTPQEFIAHLEEEATVDQSKSGHGELVVLISESYQAGIAAAKTCGLDCEADNAIFIVEESLVGQSVPKKEVQAVSELLHLSLNKARPQDSLEAKDEKLGATIFSVADVTDQTLQGVRNFVRQGKKPDAIQREVYQAFGTQRVVAPQRLDQYSKLHV